MTKVWIAVGPAYAMAAEPWHLHFHGWHTDFVLDLRAIARI